MLNATATMPVQKASVYHSIGGAANSASSISGGGGGGGDSVAIPTATIVTAIPAKRVIVYDDDALDDLQLHSNQQQKEDDGLFSRPPKRGHKFCGVCCDVRLALIIVESVRITLETFSLIGMLFMNYASQQAMDIMDNPNSTAALIAAMDDDAAVASLNAMVTDMINATTSTMDDDAAIAAFTDMMSSLINGTDGTTGFDFAAATTFGNATASSAAEDDFFNDAPPVASVNDVLAESVTPTAIVALSFLALLATILGLLGAINYNMHLVGVATLPIVVTLLASMASSNVLGLLVSAFYLYPHVVYIKEVYQGILCKETYVHERFSCCCV